MSDHEYRENFIKFRILEDYIDFQKTFNYQDFPIEINRLREKFGSSPKEQLELQAIEELISYKELVE